MAGGDLDVGEPREVAAERRADRGERLGRVGHDVHEARHARVADAGEVVADAHVEDRARGRPHPSRPRQDVHERPRDDVLVRRLVERQLLRPLDVVALVGHVDARPRDLQLVVHLDRLQLDEPAAAEPRRDDVLTELGVRAGRWADGRGERLAEEAAARRTAAVGRVEERGRDVEDRPLALVLHEDAAELGGERLDAHHVGHHRE